MLPQKGNIKDLLSISATVFIIVAFAMPYYTIDRAKHSQNKNEKLFFFK